MEVEMGEMSKDQVFLEVASGLASFYAIMGHNLRVMMEDEVSIQMPPGEVAEQFRQIHDALMPQVSRNPVVGNKIKDDYDRTMKLAKEFSNPKLKEDRAEEVKEEALRLHFYARERSASLSDLVAVFRSL
jgi:hypothetical protein